MTWREFSGRSGQVQCVEELQLPRGFGEAPPTARPPALARRRWMRANRLSAMPGSPLPWMRTLERSKKRSPDRGQPCQLIHQRVHRAGQILPGRALGHCRHGDNLQPAPATGLRALRAKPRPCLPGPGGVAGVAACGRHRPCRSASIRVAMPALAEYSARRYRDTGAKGLGNGRGRPTGGHEIRGMRGCARLGGGPGPGGPRAPQLLGRCRSGHGTGRRRASSVAGQVCFRMRSGHADEPGVVQRVRRAA